MKIFMMSTIDRVGNNKKLYREFLNKCSKVCYIPAWKSSDVKSDFKSFAKSIKKECSEVSFIPVDRKMSKKSKKDLCEADVIVIDGGNTFFLMKNLRKNGYFKLLKKMSNKTFVGISAGALALTKNINLAKVPLSTADDNIVSLKNMKGFGFVDFEFHAHATNSKNEIKELAEYSKINKQKIYLCRDGQGVFVKKDKVKISGKVSKMSNGKVNQNRSVGGTK